MEKRRLGRTDLQVSAICLGTMTWGEQNTEADGFAQMDYAVDRGVNFFDTAELYPVPPQSETQGRTEEIIGNWFAARPGARDKVILATKVVGRSEMTWHRDWDAAATRLDRKNIDYAIDRSLRRLKTDYVDLYQLHWPDRATNYFGQLGYVHNSTDDAIAIEETLAVLADLVKAGKVRHVGLSNETPYGMMKFAEAAERLGLPRMMSVQNPYSLLNRTFEVGCAEVAHREDIGLLAYSPLAFGVLSGKYLGGRWPAGARLTLFKRFARYSNPYAIAATEAYAKIAEKHGLDFAQMSLAYVTTRSFVTSNIIGATTLAQLETNIASHDLVLSDAVLSEIEAVHTAHPNPAP